MGSVFLFIETAPLNLNSIANPPAPPSLCLQRQFAQLSMAFMTPMQRPNIFRNRLQSICPPDPTPPTTANFRKAER